MRLPLPHEVVLQHQVVRRQQAERGAQLPLLAAEGLHARQPRQVQPHPAALAPGMQGGAGVLVPAAGESLLQSGASGGHVEAHT
jgi:hypothetical protein